MKQFWRMALFSLAMIGTAMTAGQAAAWKPESDEPIKLAINEWTGQVITTHIAGEILKGMGYKVDYVVAGYFPQMTALQDGSVTATLEIWTTNIADAYDKAIATTKVEDIGSLGLTPTETWFYPAFMEEQCPGLPEWTALKNCAGLFATPDTMPSGRFVDYPADWGTSNQGRIKALELPFTPIPAGSEGALVSEIKNAFAKQTPLLVMFFSPHWLFAQYDLRQVKLPPFEKDCTACDFPRGDVRKVAWVGAKDKWPAAVKVLQALRLTNAEQIPLINTVDQEGEKVEEVAVQWLADNKAVWSKWVEDAQK